VGTDPVALSLQTTISHKNDVDEECGKGTYSTGRGQGQNDWSKKKTRQEQGPALQHISGAGGAKTVSLKHGATSKKKCERSTGTRGVSHRGLLIGSSQGKNGMEKRFWRGGQHARRPEREQI